MRTQGFTLVELLMTVTVLGILTALAVPSFRGMMDRNAVTTTANDLLSSILLARSESIKREQPVIFSGNASFTTWQVAVDTNGDGSGDDTLLAHSLDGNGVGVSANVTTHPHPPTSGRRGSAPHYHKGPVLSQNNRSQNRLIRNAHIKPNNATCLSQYILTSAHSRHTQSYSQTHIHSLFLSLI